MTETDRRRRHRAGPRPRRDGAAPATTEPTPEIVGIRNGMFGIRGTGDTSGYGGLTRAIAMPAPAERPYGGWFDELADGLGQALGRGRRRHRRTAMRSRRSSSTGAS